MVVVAVGMFFSSRDWETSQDGGKAKHREILDEVLSALDQVFIKDLSVLCTVDLCLDPD